MSHAEHKISASIKIDFFFSLLFAVSFKNNVIKWQSSLCLAIVYVRTQPLIIAFFCWVIISGFVDSARVRGSKLFNDRDGTR